MWNQNSTADVLQLRKFPSSLPTIHLQLDSKHVDKGASQVKLPWDSIFSNASFSPPMLSDEEREKLLRLTTQAAESLKSRNPLMDDCIVDAVAPQLACLLAMPVPSGQSKTKTHLGSSKSPLERFKSGDVSLELRDLAGHVEEFSFDQQGSQFLQEKLEMATNEERNTIFREILPIAMNLIIDMFGNLVIQKYFDFGSLSQIRELANVLLGNVVNLTLHKYGSDVLQTALEVVDMDKRVSIAKELDGHVIQFSCDQYGSHVVAKIIECVPEELIGFLVSPLSDKITSLSVHPYAYHIIQMLLECCDEDSDRVKMLSHVLPNVYALSHDQYGNYVIQYILENGRPEERSVIIRTLSGKILAMSKHKYASNVIEKSLRFGGPQEQHRMVDEIMMLAAGHDTLQIMVHDQYGNHLVQAALEVASTEQFTNMVSRINRYLTMAQIYSCEPNVISMIERLAQHGEKMIEMRISKASQWA